MYKATSISVAGQRYAVRVPGTLDLAERAELALNALVGAADRRHRCEPFHCGNVNTHPAYMNHMWGGPCTPKVIEALPMMRIMCGRDRDLDVDREMLQAAFDDIDGGIWWLKRAGRPWHARDFGQDLTFVTMHSRVLMAMLARHGWEGDPMWLDVARQMVGGLRRIAVSRDGNVVYPDDIYYGRDWSDVLPGQGSSPFGFQWAMGQANAIRALARWYTATGDEEALDLARRAVKPLLAPERWMPSAEPRMISSADRAHWSGHFHTTTTIAWGLLEYAAAAHDVRLLQYMRDFYEYTRGFGIPRMGFFPAVAGDHGSYVVTDQGKHYGPQPHEGCDVADMICLAIGLSDAGVGDYWEDVDQYVRNHLVEHQLLRKDLLQAISAAGKEPDLVPEFMTAEDVIERNIGAFSSGSDPDLLYALWTLCCVGNCSVALYRAWEGIVRHRAGTAQVNLLLNRASPWLDVDSYEPYEGKVVVHNKTARRIHLRIPRWVDRRTLRLMVEGQPVAPLWLGNYLLLDGLSGGEEVVAEYPMVETVESYAEPSYGKTYTLEIKGNTVIDIAPRATSYPLQEMGQDDGLKAQLSVTYPIYLREAYRANQAPCRERMRFVSNTIG